MGWMKGCGECECECASTHMCVQCTSMCTASNNAHTGSREMLCDPLQEHEEDECAKGGVLADEESEAAKQCLKLKALQQLGGEVQSLIPGTSAGMGERTHQCFRCHLSAAGLGRPFLEAGSSETAEHKPRREDALHENWQQVVQTTPEKGHKI